MPRQSADAAFRPAGRRANQIQTVWCDDGTPTPCACVNVLPMLPCLHHLSDRFARGGLRYGSV